MKPSRTGVAVGLLTIVGGSLMAAGIASATTIPAAASTPSASAASVLIASAGATPSPNYVVVKVAGTSRDCPAVVVRVDPSTGQTAPSLSVIPKQCTAELAVARKAAAQALAEAKARAAVEQKEGAVATPKAQEPLPSRGEVTVQPKGAPETGGGGMAAIVSTWG